MIKRKEGLIAAEDIVGVGRVAAGIWVLACEVLSDCHRHCWAGKKNENKAQKVNNLGSSSVQLY